MRNPASGMIVVSKLPRSSDMRDGEENHFSSFFLFISLHFMLHDI